YTQRAAVIQGPGGIPGGERLGIARLEEHAAGPRYPFHEGPFPSRRRTGQLTCLAGAGSHELQKAYLPARSGAAPGSASCAERCRSAQTSRIAVWEMESKVRVCRGS